jgi:tetratricopeptide (TPR) repeat protein
MARTLLILSVILILCLGASAAWALPPVFIAGDLDSALELAGEQNKLTLAYLFREYRAQEPGAESFDEVQHRRERNVLTDRIEEEVLPNPTVLEAFEQMVCVGVSVGDDRAELRRLGLDPVFPTFAWVDTDGTVLATLGACFEPRVYAFVTSQAHGIKSLRAKDELTDEQRERLGTLYYDVGRFEQAVETLAPLVRQGTANAHVYYLYAFATRATGELGDSIAVLNQALEGCTARNPTRAEAAAIRWGPATEYDPVVLERDGEFLAILYNLGTSPLMLPALDALQEVLVTEPETTEDYLTAARAFYQGENWTKAAELYERAAEGPVRGEDREEAMARRGIAALFSGDAEAALSAFEAYLEEGLEGDHHPDVLVYAGSLHLYSSIEVDGNDYKVVDEEEYGRAAELLVTLVQEYPQSGFVPDAKHLLIEYFERDVREKFASGSAEGENEGGGGGPAYRPGR